MNTYYNVRLFPIHSFPELKNLRERVATLKAAQSTEHCIRPDQPGLPVWEILKSIKWIEHQLTLQDRHFEKQIVMRKLENHWALLHLVAAGSSLGKAAISQGTTLKKILYAQVCIQPGITVSVSDNTIISLLNDWIIAVENKSNLQKELGDVVFRDSENIPQR